MDVTMTHRAAPDEPGRGGCGCFLALESCNPMQYNSRRGSATLLQPSPAHSEQLHATPPAEVRIMGKKIKTRRPAHSFTLIELLVVVAIIALLISILLP
jgi:prepilin-type N-terminal cleavage/methylation domain-containing protein